MTDASQKIDPRTYDPHKRKRDGPICRTSQNTTSSNITSLATIFTPTSGYASTTFTTTSAVKSTSTVVRGPICEPSSCLGCAIASASPSTYKRSIHWYANFSQEYTIASDKVVQSRTLRSPQAGEDFVFDEYGKASVQKFHNSNYDYGSPTFAKVITFGNERYDAGIGGLFGCTSIIIGSRRG